MPCRDRFDFYLGNDNNDMKQQCLTVPLTLLLIIDIIRKNSVLEKYMKKRMMYLLFSLLFIMPMAAAAEPVDEVAEKERCPVCGMFVAKYAPWLAQIQMADGSTSFFDGVKDMLAYYFEPKKYGGSSSAEDIYVKDYYNQKWIDGKKAFYVVGSDTMGPMGHEFIPFASTEEAEIFKKDHSGTMVMSFDQITLEKVTELRSGMKGHSMHKMKKGS